MIPDWLAALFVLTAGVVSLGGAIATVRKWGKPVTQTLRLIVGEELPNGKRVPGMLDDVAHLKESSAKQETALSELKAALDKVVSETSPNHGTSMKDVVNSTRAAVEDLQGQVEKNTLLREQYHEDGLKRDETQNARLEVLDQRMESMKEDLAGMNRRATIALSELKEQNALLTGRLDEHTAVCAHHRS